MINSGANNLIRGVGGGLWGATFNAYMGLSPMVKTSYY